MDERDITKTKKYAEYNNLNGSIAVFKRQQFEPQKTIIKC